MKPDRRNPPLDGALGGSYRQHPPDREPIVGEVGLEIDDHLAAIAVRPRHAADEQPINPGL